MTRYDTMGTDSSPVPPTIKQLIKYQAWSNSIPYFSPNLNPSKMNGVSHYFLVFFFKLFCHWRPSEKGIGTHFKQFVIYRIAL